MSLTVAARALSTGSVNTNIADWPPGVFGVPGVPGVLHTENVLKRVRIEGIGVGRGGVESQAHAHMNYTISDTEL